MGEEENIQDSTPEPIEAPALSENAGRILITVEPAETEDAVQGTGLSSSGASGGAADAAGAAEQGAASKGAASGQDDEGPDAATGGTAHSGKLERKQRKRRLSWSSLSYTTRVTIAFALIAAMTALVAIGVVSFVWEDHFRTYTTGNMQDLAEATAERIEERLEADPTLTLSSISALTPAEAAIEVTPGVAVKVVDADDNTVFDSSTRLSNGGSTGVSFEPSDASKVARAKVVVDDKVVGSVRIWVYGSDTLMRGPDQEFRANSYQAILFAAIVAIILASCIGFLFARSLVRPINRMTKTARAIKEGNLSARTNLTGDDEIARLGETFDAMAESVEKDRALERRLTTDVAHELRTPLMAIQSTVEAMVDGVFEPDEERLGTVNSEVQRLSRLVDALLKLSRLENRTTPMKEEVVDVGELISSIVATHEAFVVDSGLTFSYSADKDVLVVGDPDMIRQATANLISNAVRYTPEGGHVSVEVKKGDIMASIAVRDTGIGLTPEEARMVFSRFWRADAGRNRESGGLGIGLAVVKEIVDRHGGWVQVEGKKGEGSCFTIHIPLYDDKRTRENDRRQQQKQQRQQFFSGSRGAKADAGRKADGKNKASGRKSKGSAQ